MCERRVIVSALSLLRRQTDPVKEKVSKEFHTALEKTVRAHLTKFGQDALYHKSRVSTRKSNEF